MNTMTQHEFDTRAGRGDEPTPYFRTPPMSELEQVKRDLRESDNQLQRLVMEFEAMEIDLHSERRTARVCFIAAVVAVGVLIFDLVVR